jgi:hypothetical protein
MLLFILHEGIHESDLSSIVLELLWLCKEVHLALMNEVLCFIWVFSEFIWSLNIFLFVHIFQGVH